MAAPKRGLGSKGLGIDALIHNNIDNINKLSDGTVSEIDINKIEPNKKQPRRHFEENALVELSESLKEYGVIQPIIINKNGDYYELIAGERRWRAAKIAGLKKIPAIIRTYDEMKAFQVALIENIQRENLNPIEESLSYKRLVDEYGYSQEEVSKIVGKSRSAIANSLRLLSLDERIQNFLIENKISGGHARALLSLEDNDIQFEFAEKIIEEDLSVRDIESLVKKELENRENQNKEIHDQKEKGDKHDKDAYPFIEEELKSILGTKVNIKNKKNKGKIEIEYYSNDDLDRLIGIIKGIQR